MKKPPLFYGVFTNRYRDQTGDIVGDLMFHCPFCRSRHFHPMRVSATKQEHRWAHCGDGSPLHETGYFIAPWPIGYPEAAAHFKTTPAFRRRHRLRHLHEIAEAG